MALDAMTRKGIKEETRKALSSLNLMMDYGLTRHLIDQNPARLLKLKILLQRLINHVIVYCHCMNYVDCGRL